MRRGDIYVDADALGDYKNELSRTYAQLVNDAEELSYVFSKAQWNDAVAEKARQQTNEYITGLNHGLDSLKAAITAAEELHALAQEYLSYGY